MKQSLQILIEQHWYQKISLPLSIILLPLSLLYKLIVSCRCFLYKFNILKRYSLPVPVVVVGNITVGGVGKTPLTKHLAQELNKIGIKSGIILRGYGGKNKCATIVTADSDSEIVGDEALIYAKNGLSVAIGSNRYLAGCKLLEMYPDTQMILSDDGLQHYQLNRDYEIAVIDSRRILGNGFLLPMGPLRESVQKLKNIDMIIVNSGDAVPSGNTENSAVISSSQIGVHVVEKIMQQVRVDNNCKVDEFNIPYVFHSLVLDRIYNPVNQVTLSLESIKNKNVAALAGIGDPEKFFTFLRNLGVKLTKTYAFPDHYRYKSSDIPNDYEIILVTDKDYTKLAKFNLSHVYVVAVTSSLSSDTLINALVGLR